jgi:tol-pal system protein YbgF
MKIWTGLKKYSSQAALAACTVAVLTATSALVPPSVWAQQTADVSARISRLEADIDTLSRAVFKGEKIPASAMQSSSGGSSDYQANVEVRLSDLERQMRELTGKVEQQSFENTQLKQRLDKALADIDMRLGGAGSAAVTGDAGLPTRQSGTLAPQDMGGTVANNTEPAANIPLTNPSDPNAPAPMDSPTQRNLGTLTTAPGGASIAPQAGNDPAGQYEMAFSQLKSGNFAPARNGFEEFLKTYPTHPLAANATYWLGESYYGQGQYDKAARIFAESYKKYPQGPKVADSLLKMGMALGSGGKKNEACVTLKQLKKEFPTGQGVTIRRAEQEMTKLGCTG